MVLLPSSLSAGNIFIRFLFDPVAKKAGADLYPEPARLLSVDSFHAECRVQRIGHDSDSFETSMHRRRCFHLQSDSPFARLDKLSCILRLAFITLPESQVGLSLLNFSHQQMIVANSFGGPTHFARTFRRRGLAALRLKPPQTTVVFHQDTFQPTPPLVKNGSANGIRTRVPALRGQCPRPLDDSAVFRRAARVARVAAMLKRYFNGFASPSLPRHARPWASSFSPGDAPRDQAAR